MLHHLLPRPQLLLAGASIVIAATTACGPKTVAPPPPPPDEARAVAPPTTEDVTAEVGPLALTGTRFVPEAMPPPPMPRVTPSKRTTLAKERAAWKRLAKSPRATAAERATAAHVLATLLYDEAVAKPAGKAAPLAEARLVVQAVLDATPQQADALTLEIAAALAFAAGDEAAAEPYLAELAGRFVNERAGLAAKAQLGFARLRQDRTAEAAAIVGYADPSPDVPELAYVIAWLRFRAGDGERAAGAIRTAAAGWTDAAYRTPLLRDFLVMTARGGVAPADAAATIASLFPARDLRYAFTYQLSKAYALAGRPDDAAAAIDLAVAVVGDTVQKRDLAVYRTEQAEYAWQAGRVEDIAPAFAAAKAALDGCTDCGEGDQQALAMYAAQRATDLRGVYDGSADTRYRAATAALYELAASLPAGDAKDAAKQARALAAGPPPEVESARYVMALLIPVGARQQELQACYDQVLQGEPALAGAMALALEIDQTGKVIGAAGDPPAGDAGLAAVSRCIEARARAWSLPGRPRAGVARITMRLTVAPAEPTPPAAAPASP